MDTYIDIDETCMNLYAYMYYACTCIHMEGEREGERERESVVCGAHIDRTHKFGTQRSSASM